MTTPQLLPRSTEDQRLVRWSIGAQRLPPDCPELQALIHDGVLEDFECTTGDVRTRLAIDRSWSVDGPRVRSALFSALLSSASSVAPNGAGVKELSDADLLTAIRALVDREIAPVIASHGGDIHVHSVAHGTLTVELTGACRHCPVAGRTLTSLVQTQVQAHFPQIRGVRSRHTGPRRLPWLRPPTSRISPPENRGRSPRSTTEG